MAWEKSNKWICKHKAAYSIIASAVGAGMGYGITYFLNEKFPSSYSPKPWQMAALGAILGPGMAYTYTRKTCKGRK